MSSPIVMTARHLLKTAPRSRYSARRSRSPSRPSVIVSPFASASGFAPRSTLIPGRMPWSLRIFTSGAPSAAFWRMVSSYRITALMYFAAPGARNSSSRYARRLSSVFGTPIASNRRLIVLVLSSAARMPFPGATNARAMSCSPTADRIPTRSRSHRDRSGLLAPRDKRGQQHADAREDDEDRPHAAPRKVQQEDRRDRREEEARRERAGCPRHGLMVLPRVPRGRERADRRDQDEERPPVAQLVAEVVLHKEQETHRDERDPEPRAAPATAAHRGHPSLRSARDGPQRTP